MSIAPNRTVKQDKGWFISLNWPTWVDIFRECINSQNAGTKLTCFCRQCRSKSDCTERAV